MRIYYDPATETAPTLIAGAPPVDQTALVAALQAQIAALTGAQPPATGDVVLIGSAIANKPYRVGPADRAKRADLDAAIAATPPWAWFHNAAQEFSPPRNGVRPTAWVRLPVWGNFGGLYAGMPRLNPDGTISNVGSKAPGDDVTLIIVPFLKTAGLRPGVRGAAITTPYTSWQFHPRKLPDGSLSMNPAIPHMIGLDMLGQFVFRMRDGSVQFPITVPGAKEPHDFTFNPANRKLVYIADTGNDRVIEWDRTIAPGTFRTLFSIPRPTSVRCLDDGTLGIVSTVKNSSVASLWKWNGGTLTKLRDIPDAFYLDYDSQQRFIVATLTMSVIAVDLNNVATTLRAPDPAAPQTWASISVDRNGTCGPVDEMMLVGMHLFQNAGYLQYTGGQWVNGLSTIQNGNGQTTIGNTLYTVDYAGHYPWSAVYSPEGCERYFEGASDLQGSLVVGRTATMAPEDNYDHAAFTAGREIVRWGSGPGVAQGARPTFTCQMSEQGWSGIGVTADWIAEKTFAQQAAFVQGGMLGSFPRPDLVGRDLYRALYFLNRSSQKGFRVGKPHFDALLAFCQPTFGQEWPALAVQHGTQSDLDTFMEVQRTGSALAVKFFSQFDNVKPPAAGLVVRVVIDEGIPGAIDLGSLMAPFVLTALPTLSPGQHSLRAVPVGGVANLAAYQGRASVVVVP